MEKHKLLKAICWTLCHEMTSLLCVLPPQNGHDGVSQVEGVATSGRPSWAELSRSLATSGDLLQTKKMGKTEEESKNVGKIFENFIQASTCKGTLQAFNLLCRRLDLDPADHTTFYSSLKAKVTSWKAKALWNKLDKRMAHKDYKKGQACVGTKVSFIISFHH